MRALRQYGTEYVALEDAAHQAHKGMWQGSFQMPAEWRREQKIDKLLAQRGQSLQQQGANLRLCTTCFAVLMLWLSGYYSCFKHLHICWQPMQYLSGMPKRNSLALLGLAPMQHKRLMRLLYVPSVFQAHLADSASIACQWCVSMQNSGTAFLLPSHKF